MSDYETDTSGTPYVSLKRTYVILLIVYGCGAGFALLAGAALTWHVDPYSECLLYSGPVGNKIEYGHEAICETIAYLYLGCVIGAITMFYITFMHRKKFLDFFNSGNFTKSEQLLTVNKPILMGHSVITLAIVILTLALTIGYSVACNNISDREYLNIREKLSKDPTLARGEAIDERLNEDHKFWKYTSKVSNTFGQDLYVPRITCRAVFTDPDVHQKLRDAHADKYKNYYSLWYKVDLYAFDSRTQAILQNNLIEATLAGGWISVLLWVGSIIFIIIQRTYIRKEKNKFDRFNPHNMIDGGSMRKDGSMISGYPGSGYTSGNMSNFQRGGLRGSNQSMKSVRSRRDVDELAFASLGLTSQTGTMTSGYQSHNGDMGQLSRPMLPPVHNNAHMQNFRQPMQMQMQPSAGHMQYVPNQYTGQPMNHTYLHDNTETEIM